MYVKKNQRRLAEKDPSRLCSRLSVQLLTYDPTAATTSAFVQQRGKLFPAAFEEVLRRFTYQNRPIRRWNGYTLLAVDGSHVQIPSNIHDERVYLSFFRRLPQHEIDRQYGRCRTAGYQIQKVLRQLRAEIEGNAQRA